MRGRPITQKYPGELIRNCTHNFYTKKCCGNQLSNHFGSNSTFSKVLPLDGPICANRFADSRESPDSRESFQGSRIEPPFCESRFGGGGGVKIANRRFLGDLCESLARNENRGFVRLPFQQRRFSGDFSIF